MDDDRSVPFVRVVVLDFNGGSMIVDSIGALTRTKWPSGRVEIVCVDNGSTDGSIETIEREFPAVRVIRNGGNLGFPGNNAALRDLDDVSYVALVNSDAFVEPDWLTPLVETAEADRGVGAVCPKILFAVPFGEVAVECLSSGKRTTPHVRLRAVSLNGVDVFGAAHVAGGGGRTSDRSGVFEVLSGNFVVRIPLSESGSGDAVSKVELEFESAESCTLSMPGVNLPAFELVAGERTKICVDVQMPPVDVLNNVGSWLDEHWAGHERGLHQVENGQFDEGVEVGAWCGAAVLLRADYLSDVGLFDENYFLYYEDTDLSVRGRGRGWRYVTQPLSVVRHVHSASTIEGSEFAETYIERNRLLLIGRHAPLMTVFTEHIRFVLVTASYARQSLREAVSSRSVPDLSRVRRRMRSLVGAVRLSRASLRARRHSARQRLLTTEELRGQLFAGSKAPSS